MDVTQPDHASPDTPDLPNMDELESNESFSLFSSQEHRSAELSELWIRHGERLAESSPSGSLAAYLRAAHLAAFAIQADPCSDPFNEECSRLREVYERALTVIVARVQDLHWQPPNLAPTRYRLSLLAEDEPLLEQRWHFVFPSHSAGPRTTVHRTGIGVEAAGCRRLPDAGPRAAPVEVCAPLTFILLFDTPPSSETTQATLTAYDSFRREAADLGGRSVSLASDIESAWIALTRQLASDKAIRLACFSTPGDDEAAILGISDPERLIGDAHSPFLGLLANREISDHFGLCIYPLRSAANRDRQGRELAKIVRQLASRNTQDTLLPRPSQFLLVPEGSDASATVSSFLAHVSRAKKSLARRRDASRIVVRGVYPLPSSIDTTSQASGAAAQLASRTSDLHVPIQSISNSTSAEIHKQLTAAVLSSLTVSGEHTEEANHPEAHPFEQLDLSPVY